MRLRNVDILGKFLKDWALNQKYIKEKDDFEILRYPYETFNCLWGHILFNEKFAHHRIFFFYQNWFINYCAWKNFLNSLKDGKTKFFFVRCRRTYVLNKIS